MIIQELSPMRIIPRPNLVYHMETYSSLFYMIYSLQKGIYSFL